MEYIIREDRYKEFSIGSALSGIVSKVGGAVSGAGGKIASTGVLKTAGIGAAIGAVGGGVKNVIDRNQRHKQNVQSAINDGRKVPKKPGIVGSFLGGAAGGAVKGAAGGAIVGGASKLAFGGQTFSHPYDFSNAMDQYAVLDYYFRCFSAFSNMHNFMSDRNTLIHNPSGKTGRNVNVIKLNSKGDSSQRINPIKSVIHGTAPRDKKKMREGPRILGQKSTAAKVHFTEENIEKETFEPGDVENKA